MFCGYLSITMIWWAIVFKVIEYVASMIVFKLFIYEEICQSGNIQLYIAENGPRNIPSGFILQKIFKYAYNPAMDCLKTEAQLCPWGADIFDVFFRAEKLYLNCYGG